MQFVYSSAIYLYYLGIVVASVFNSKAKRWLDGRKGIFKKIAGSVYSNDRLIWFHASSLGEFEQGRPVIEAIKEKYPEYKILLTFFSPSGYEIRKNYQGADYVFYLPLDTQKNARRFLQLVRPEKVFFIKYEFWYWYIINLYRKNIPVYLVSAIFRDKQLFFQPFGSWYRKILQHFTHIFVQDKTSLMLLSEFGIRDAGFTGDTRFDRVAEISKQTRSIDIAEKFCASKTTIVCGSTWDKDEEFLIEYINRLTDSLTRFIIAPHEIHTTHIHRIVSGLKKPAILYSEANSDNITDKQVLIIDNIGMLSSLYKYGKWAYIGGGFGVGIHNILEAAAFGIPVVFGPNYQKFKEATDLIALGGAYTINNYQGLCSIFNELLIDSQKRNEAGTIAGNYITDNQGATAKILQEVFGE